MEEKGGTSQGGADGDETPRTAAVQTLDDRIMEQQQETGMILNPSTAEEIKTTARQRPQTTDSGEEQADTPATKRFKPIASSSQQPAAKGSRTPAIVTENTKTPCTSNVKGDHDHNHDEDRKMPADDHRQRRASSGSVSPSSDISSNSSHSQRYHAVASPIPTSAYAHQEVPPAPPSTPASHPKALLDAGLATPLPFREGVLNAYQLEQQQLLLEGAETPAPKRDSSSGGRVLSMTEDFSEWAVSDRYKMIRILGRGSYGEVAQAVDKYAGRPDAYVAIKRILSPFDQEIDSIRLYREIHILRRLRGHGCIINLLDVVQPPTDDLDDFHDLYLVFEYVDTDLYKLIMSPQYLTTEHIQTFLYQMLTGLKYIHSFSVIHRDLKPANILLNEDCSLKICDFGLARIVTSEQEDKSKTGTTTDPLGPKHSKNFASPPQLGITRQLTKHVVTRWYRAPELILIQPYTSAVDIWSLGCILAELLSMQEGSVAGYQDRKPLFPGGTCYPLSGDLDTIKTEERLDQLSMIFGIIGTPSAEDLASIGNADEYIGSIKQTKGTPLESIYPEADPAAIDLLNRMLRFNPKSRCTAEEALDHEFFKGVRRKELETVADAPLVGPAFLDSLEIDLETLKQKIFEEVRWFQNVGDVRQKAERQDDVAAAESGTS